MRLVVDLEETTPLTPSGGCRRDYPFSCSDQRLIPPTHPSPILRTDFFKGKKTVTRDTRSLRIMRGNKETDEWTDESVTDG